MSRYSVLGKRTAVSENWALRADSLNKPALGAPAGAAKRRTKIPRTRCRGVERRSSAGYHWDAISWSRRWV